MMLASLRRLIRPAGIAPLSPIRSLAYFQPVIEELRTQPLPDGYPDYLRLKLGHVVQGCRRVFKKLRFQVIDNRFASPW